MNERAVLLAILCSSLFSGSRICGDVRGDADAREQRITDAPYMVFGEALYRERVLLPEGATMQVVAEESRDEGEAPRHLAAETLGLVGSPPYPFTLTLEHHVVEDPSRVSIHVTIYVDGEPRFTNTEPVPAFEGDQPRTSVEVLLHPMRGAEE